MNPKARKLISRVLLGTLALSTLASLMGAGALVLERNGTIVLRRVPSPILMSWKDAKGTAVAIINTDTTPGSFLLGIAVERRGRGHHHVDGHTSFARSHCLGRRGVEDRVWVPSRSIVLRTSPQLTETDCDVRLYDARGISVGHFVPNGLDRAIPRGTRVALEWRYSNDAWDRGNLPNSFAVVDVSWCSREGIHFVEQPGVTPAKTQQSDSFYEYSWDGKTPVLVEVDTITPPDIRDVTVFACDGGGRLGTSELWAYDPDLTIVDERPTLDPTK